MIMILLQTDAQSISEWHKNDISNIYLLQSITCLPSAQHLNTVDKNQAVLFIFSKIK